MNITASRECRPKGSVENACWKLTLESENQIEPFILAAIRRFMLNDVSDDLRSMFYDSLSKVVLNCISEEAKSLGGQ